MNSIQYERSLDGTTATNVGTTAAATANYLSDASTTSSGLVDKLFNHSWNTWLVVILIFAILGINVFYILGKGTQQVAALFQPIINVFYKMLKLFGFTTLETIKQTANVSATGTNVLANTVAETTINASNKIEQIGATPIGTTTSASIKTAQGQTQQNGSQIDYGQENNEMMDVRHNTLQIALNDAETHMEQNNQNKNDGINPDDSYSSIQSGNKAGWCYIGEERGIRSCMNVGINDQCMSGDVFPTSDVCVNPRLRV